MPDGTPDEGDLRGDDKQERRCARESGAVPRGVLQVGAADGSVEERKCGGPCSDAAVRAFATDHV